jgi:ABC-type multidrug transport system fused ATPase/permease subunit
MSLIKNIAECVKLLENRAQKKFLFLIFGSCITSILDFVGLSMLLAGLYIANSYSQSGTLPNKLLSILELLGLNIDSIVKNALIIGTFAGFLLISRSILNALMIKKIYQFLSEQQLILTSTLARKLLNSSILLFQSNSSQQISYSLSAGASAGVTTLLGSFSVVISELVLIGIICLLLFFINPILTVLLTLFFLGVGIILQKYIGPWVSIQGATRQSSSIKTNQIIQEIIFGFREIKASNREESQLKRLEVELSKLTKSLSNELTGIQIPKIIYEIAIILVSGLILLYGKYYSDGTSVLAIFALYLTASFRLLPSSLRLSNQLISMKSLVEQSSDLMDLHKRFLTSDKMQSTLNKEIYEISYADNLSIFEPSLVIDNLDFRYPRSDTLILRNLYLVLQPGESLAITGKSGVGKSTLADLILGLLAPSKGSIKISGEKPEIASKKWPGLIAYVPQNCVVINGSIRENLLFGLDEFEVTEDQIIAALKKSEAFGLISEKEHGLDTEIGENGFQLSGGQRQRLVLARTLLLNPKFLVLDEATSALDHDTEKDISKTIASLDGVTRIIISHRNSMIEGVNHQIFLSDRD